MGAGMRHPIDGPVHIPPLHLLHAKVTGIWGNELWLAATLVVGAKSASRLSGLSERMRWRDLWIDVFLWFMVVSSGGDWFIAALAGSTTTLTFLRLLACWSFRGRLWT